MSNEDDFDSDLGDLLSDDDDENLLKKKKSKPINKSIDKVDINTVNSSTSSIQKKNNPVVKSKISFDDDDDDFMNSLGFNEPAKPAQAQRRSSKSILDDFLGLNDKKQSNSPSPQPTKLENKQEQVSEPVFGSYQPSATTNKSRSGPRRSVRFQEGVKNLESTKPNTPKTNESQKSSEPIDKISTNPNESSTSRRQSRNVDWLGLSSEEHEFTTSKNDQIDKMVVQKKGKVAQSEVSLNEIDLAKKSLNSSNTSHSKSEINFLGQTNDSNLVLKNSKKSSDALILNRDDITFTKDSTPSLMRPTDAIDAIPKQLKEDFEKKDMHADLQLKIKLLEMENKQNLKTVENMQEYHKNEITSLTESHKRQLKIMEEMFESHEMKYKSENELLSKQMSTKVLEFEKSQKLLIESYQEKLENAHKEKLLMADKMKELHQQQIATLKDEHESAIKRLQEIKDCEIEAALSTQNHMKSIQLVVNNLKDNSKELSDLRTKIQSAQSEDMMDKQNELKVKDQQLQELQSRLNKQQIDMDTERSRLQTLILKLEKRIENEKVTNEEDRWKLVQQRNQLSVEREAINQERQLLEERISRERTQLDRSKQSIFEDQKILVEKLCEEQRLLSAERAKIAGQSKQKIDEDMNQSFKNLKVIAEYEGKLSAVKDDVHQLDIRKNELKHEFEKLMRSQQVLKKEQHKLQMERERLDGLALELKRKSQLVEEMCKQAVKDRKEGEMAFEQSQKVENENSQQLESMQKQLTILHEKEKQIATEKQFLNASMKAFEEQKNRVLCVKCLTPISSSSISTPRMLKHSHLNFDMSDKISEWKNLSLQDEKFLEEESFFLRSTEKIIISIFINSYELMYVFILIFDQFINFFMCSYQMNDFCKIFAFKDK